MKRTNVIGLLALLALAVVPSCKSATTKPPPTSQAASVPSDAAQRGLSESGLRFNSKLALGVWILDENGESRFIGRTPAAQPLMIPKCRWWAVQPEPGVSLADVLEEARAKGIGGLKLENASDEAW
jgi:hypothetical protein